MMNEPMIELDGATVLHWLKAERSITYTGKTTMYHDGVLIDNPAGFAICQNDEDDILVFYCDNNWNVLAAVGYKSINEAKEGQEVAYRGTLSEWKQHETKLGNSL